MVGAIGVPLNRAGAAEVELRVVGMAVRPQATRPAEFEKIALRDEFRPGLAPRHCAAVKPADYRIFRQAHSPADLRGRQTFLKQLIQQLDALRRPGHFHRFPPYTVDPPVHPHKIRYHACGPLASDIYIWVKRYLRGDDSSPLSRNRPESAHRA